jgi:hypothetical protein
VLLQCLWRLVSADNLHEAQRTGSGGVRRSLRERDQLLQQIFARVEWRAALHILHPPDTGLTIYAGLLMTQQLTFQLGSPNTEVIHEIVQYALRSAATASTANGAIDVLGQALLEVERLVAHKGVLTH